MMNREDNGRRGEDIEDKRKGRRKEKRREKRKEIKEK